MPAPTLDFWFDFASTYSYIAAMQIEERCTAAGVTLAWKPFLLGPIFELQGWDDSPFNLNARRGAYMWRDLERLTGKYDLPWRKPSRFPRPSTLPARVACSIAALPWCGSFVKRVFVANFGEDREIGEREVIVDLLRDLGRDGETLIDAALHPDNRGLLRANTTRASELGIFGAPDCVVDGELFWGEETLDDAIAWAVRAARTC